MTAYRKNQMVNVKSLFCGEIIAFVDEVKSTGILFTYHGKQYFELFYNVTPYKEAVLE